MVEVIKTIAIVATVWMVVAALLGIAVGKFIYEGNTKER
jgi:hypothetical protein